MLKRKNKPQERYLPTAEEFLTFIPVRLEFEWSENQEGLVQIKVPKFKGNLGKSFLKVIKKDNNFTANMDKYGSIVWKNSDGINTVKDILEIMKKEFPGQENLDQRLFLFIRQMQALSYLELK